MSGITVRCKVGAKPEKPVEASPPPPRPPSRVARQLALAYKIERAIEAGELKDYAEAARRLGVTRARVTQVVNLLNLPPAVQARILEGESDLTERGLRPFLRATAHLPEPLVMPSDPPPPAAN